jgi:hypothetical protein
MLIFSCSTALPASVMNKVLLFPLLFLFFGFTLPDKGPAWKIIASGDSSNQKERKTEIFSNKKQFLKAWMTLRKADANLPGEPPIIDFKKKLIIVCYAGSETNGLEADSLWAEKGNLHVRLLRISMNPNCHGAKLLVTPFVLIETDRVGWNVVKEEERVKTMECKE